MQKDLFQISQMNDIYYTLSLWSVLSPDMKGEGDEKQAAATGGKTRKNKKRTDTTAPAKNRIS